MFPGRPGKSAATLTSLLLTFTVPAKPPRPFPGRWTLGGELGGACLFQPLLPWLVVG